jgi:chemotaxis protein MotB
MLQRFIPLAILIPLLVSCVGKKKYLQMEYLQEECMKRERQLQAQLDFARAQIEQLQSRNEELNNVLGVLRDDKAQLESDTSRLEERLRDVARRARSTQDQLGAELEATAQQLAAKEALIAEIEQVLDRRDERLLAAQKNLKDDLRFMPVEDVSIEMRNGQLFLTLSDQLIFGGRSTNISSDGEKTLGTIASILNRYPDLAVTVMGHTSTDRPHRGYADNWDLSVRRAANVVRTFTEEHDVSPNQITAAGKGEYRPLVSNDSTHNKLKNRRLEIILTPRLETLYSILRETP